MHGRHVGIREGGGGVYVLFERVQGGTFGLVERVKGGHMGCLQS
jgi:hypothetical protein